MSMVRIRVHDFTGDDCALGEDGERIFEIAHPALLAGEEVVMDFAGVLTFASPCLNVAIGQLLADIPPDALNDKLGFENVALQGDKTIQRVIENAKSYYLDPDLHRAVFSSEREDDE